MYRYILNAFKFGMTNKSVLDNVVAFSDILRWLLCYLSVFYNKCSNKN